MNSGLLHVIASLIIEKWSATTACNIFTIYTKLAEMNQFTINLTKFFSVLRFEINIDIQTKLINYIPSLITLPNFLIHRLNKPKSNSKS